MNYREIFIDAQRAGRALAELSDTKINEILLALAEQTVANADYIISENAKDLALMSRQSPNWDRLMLDKKRIDDIASEIRNVASLPSPLGIVQQSTTRPNGMRIDKISVPFGVVGVIYEARPNVGFDSFSLCFKSGNAVLLKGGSDAWHSNCAVVQTIRQVLQEHGVTQNAVTLLPREREAVGELCNAVGYVDLVIPRGSRSLIDFVRDNARVPIIETGAGICHTYIDKDCDTDIAQSVITNAKCRRVSVCNALDCMIVHSEHIDDLPYICQKLQENEVEIFADAQAYHALEGKYEKLNKATNEDFGTEFLSLRMAIKTVDNVQQAVEHITKYGSKHSEAIISSDQTAIDIFRRDVDAACVYVNVSTAYTDGAQFGMGAEIGISTQKLHARGPMALRELTTYKYLITGNGQIRA